MPPKRKLGNVKVKKPKKKVKKSKPKSASKSKSGEQSNEVHINIDTLNRSKCLKNGQLRSLLGGGHFGEVYDYCDEKQSCRYVLKVQFFQNTDFFDTYLRETFFHSYIQQNSRIPIAPKLYDHWTCTDDSVGQEVAIGCMVMDKWDGNLYTIQGELKKDQIDTLEKQMHGWATELARLKVYHLDQYLRNFLYRVRNGKMEFALADWGNAMFAMRVEDVKNEIGDSVFDLYKDNFNAIIESLRDGTFIM